MKPAVKIWLWFSAALAILVVAELGLRATLPALDPASQFRMLSGLGSAPTLAPASERLRQQSLWGEYSIDVEIDRYGLRERKPIISADDRAIFVVGEQFAFGEGVRENERFSNLVERTTEVPVYNISMRGILPWGHYKLVYYAEQIVRYARNPEFKIKHLIVVVSLDGDVKRYGDLDKIPPQPLPIEPGSSFARFSLLSWLAERTAIGIGSQIVLYKYMLSQDHGILNALGAYDLAQSVRAWLWPRSIPAPAPVDAEAIRQTVAQLKKMAALRDTIFVVMPPRGLFLKDRAGNGQRLHDQFLDELSSSGLSFVDALPALREAAKSRTVLFRHEEQWNAAGHAAVAELLTSAIRRKWGIAGQ